MIRGRRNAAQKRGRTLLSVIRFLPVLAYVRSSPFRPSPIFRRPLFMCFSATVSRQRRELPTRQWASLPFLSSPLRPFCRELSRVSRREKSTRESNVKYFGSVNRWKVHPFPFRGAVLPFSFGFFRDAKVSWS